MYRSVTISKAARIEGVRVKRGSKMAVPKQKKGRGATHTRRSANSKLAAPSRSVCPQCGAPHHVCPNCGYYKDREVIVTE